MPDAPRRCVELDAVKPVFRAAAGANGRTVMRKQLIVLALTGILAAIPAGAVVVPFGGDANGTDPLGEQWTASGTHWGEPGFLAGDIVFNPLAISNGAGDYATSFSFTFLKGDDGTIDQTPSVTPFGTGPETRFTNLTDGVAWLVSFADGNVTFTAPTMASKLDPGNHFFVNIEFTGIVDPERFSFAGLWDDAAVHSVPEPGTWVSMAGGFGLLGFALRNRRRQNQRAV